jgi:isocitrate dehydrogenase
MKAVVTIFDAVRVPLDYKYVAMGKDIYLQGHSAGMTAEARKTVEKLGILFKGPMETPKGKGKSFFLTFKFLYQTF